MAESVRDGSTGPPSGWSPFSSFSVLGGSQGGAPPVWSPIGYQPALPTPDPWVSHASTPGSLFSHFKPNADHVLPVTVPVAEPASSTSSLVRAYYPQSAACSETTSNDDTDSVMTHTSADVEMGQVSAASPASSLSPPSREDDQLPRTVKAILVPNPRPITPTRPPPVVPPLRQKLERQWHQRHHDEDRLKPMPANPAPRQLSERQRILLQRQQNAQTHRAQPAVRVDQPVTPSVPATRDQWRSTAPSKKGRAAVPPPKPKAIVGAGMFEMLADVPGDVPAAEESKTEVSLSEESAPAEKSESEGEKADEEASEEKDEGADDAESDDVDDDRDDLERDQVPALLCWGATLGADKLGSCMGAAWRITTGHRISPVLLVLLLAPMVVASVVCELHLRAAAYVLVFPRALAMTVLIYVLPSLHTYTRCPVEWGTAITAGSFLVFLLWFLFSRHAACGWPGLDPRVSVPLLLLIEAGIVVSTHLYFPAWSGGEKLCLAFFLLVIRTKPVLSSTALLAFGAHLVVAATLGTSLAVQWVLAVALFATLHISAPRERETPALLSAPPGTAVWKLAVQPVLRFASNVLLAPFRVVSRLSFAYPIFRLFERIGMPFLWVLRRFTILWSYFIGLISFLLPCGKCNGRLWNLAFGPYRARPKRLRGVPIDQRPRPVRHKKKRHPVPAHK